MPTSPGAPSWRDRRRGTLPPRPGSAPSPPSVLGSSGTGAAQRSSPSPRRPQPHGGPTSRPPSPQPDALRVLDAIAHRSGSRRSGGQTSTDSASDAPSPLDRLSSPAPVVVVGTPLRSPLRSGSDAPSPPRPVLIDAVPVHGEGLRRRGSSARSCWPGEGYVPQVRSGAPVSASKPDPLLAAGVAEAEYASVHSVALCIGLIDRRGRLRGEAVCPAALRCEVDTALRRLFAAIDRRGAGAVSLADCRNGVAWHWAHRYPQRGARDTVAADCTALALSAAGGTAVVCRQHLSAYAPAIGAMVAAELFAARGQGKGASSADAALCVDEFTAVVKEVLLATVQDDAPLAGAAAHTVLVELLKDVAATEVLAARDMPYAQRVALCLAAHMFDPPGNTKDRSAGVLPVQSAAKPPRRLWAVRRGLLGPSMMQRGGRRIITWCAARHARLEQRLWRLSTAGGAAHTLAPQPAAGGPKALDLYASPARRQTGGLSVAQPSPARPTRQVLRDCARSDLHAAVAAAVAPAPLSRLLSLEREERAALDDLCFKAAVWAGAIGLLASVALGVLELVAEHFWLGGDGEASERLFTAFALDGANLLHGGTRAAPAVVNGTTPAWHEDPAVWWSSRVPSRLVWFVLCHLASTAVVSTAALLLVGYRTLVTCYDVAATAGLTLHEASTQRRADIDRRCRAEGRQRVLRGGVAEMLRSAGCFVAPLLFQEGALTALPKDHHDRGRADQAVLRSLRALGHGAEERRGVVGDAISTVRDAVDDKRRALLRNAVTACALGVGHGDTGALGVAVKDNPIWLMAAQLLATMAAFLSGLVFTVATEIFLGRFLHPAVVPFTSVPVTVVWNIVVCRRSMAAVRRVVSGAVAAEAMAADVMARYAEVAMCPEHDTERAPAARTERVWGYASRLTWLRALLVVLGVEQVAHPGLHIATAAVAFHAGPAADPYGDRPCPATGPSETPRNTAALATPEMEMTSVTALAVSVALAAAHSPLPPHHCTDDPTWKLVGGAVAMELLGMALAGVALGPSGRGAKAEGHRGVLLATLVALAHPRLTIAASEGFDDAAQRNGRRGVRARQQRLRCDLFPHTVATIDRKGSRGAALIRRYDGAVTALHEGRNVTGHTFVEVADGLMQLALALRAPHGRRGEVHA